MCWAVNALSLWIVSEMLSDRDFVRLCRKHGTDRILFATDSPWADQDSYVKKILSLPLTEEEKDAILGGNAQKLLLSASPAMA